MGLCLLSSQADEAGHRLLTGFVASPLPRAAMGEEGAKPRTEGRGERAGRTDKLSAKAANSKAQNLKVLAISHQHIV